LKTQQTCFKPVHSKTILDVISERKKKEMKKGKKKKKLQYNHFG
jgi:hypothetical protein